MGEVFGGLAVYGVWWETREEGEGVVVEGDECWAWVRVRKDACETRGGEGGETGSKETEGWVHRGQWRGCRVGQLRMVGVLR